MNRIKTARWLIIPAMFLVGLVAYNIREQSIKADYRRLDSSNKDEEKQAVESLVAGCWRKKPREHLLPFRYLVSPSSYLAKRLLENCRTLYRAPLDGAELSGAKLNGADLRDASLVNADLSGAELDGANLSGAELIVANLNRADLSSADLSHTNLSGASFYTTNLSSAELSGANLSGAKLGGADLSGAKLYAADLRGANLTTIYHAFAYRSDAKLGTANLSDADLSYADLSAAFLLAIDLRKVQNLTAAQLQGEKPPYLCNVALPPNIRGIDPNRNCDALPPIYSRRYSLPLEVAQTIVNKARKKQW